MTLGQLISGQRTSGHIGPPAADLDASTGQRNANPLLANPLLTTVPRVSGVLTATLATRVVVPALYLFVHRARLPEESANRD